MLLFLLLSFSLAAPTTPAHDTRPRSTARGARQRGRAVEAPLPRPGLDLDAKELGCKGDGKTDDTQCLQKAIETATCQGQPAPCAPHTLRLPAGVYLVRSQLNLPFKPPINLVGDGHDLSVIQASEPMHAVLNLTCNSGPGAAPAGGAATPRPSEGVYIGDVSISARGLANYSVFAPGIARSRFSRVKVDGARLVGVSAGFGWCNYFEGCRFGGNRVGLHVYNSANNIVVTDSIFEANDQAGAYLSDGYQFLVEGNTLESNGVGIVVGAAQGVILSGNYFEANPDKTLGPAGVVTLHPATGTTAPPITMGSDILLSGAPMWHDGSSWFVDGAPMWQYGRGYCPSGIIIKGNTHACHSNTSLVLAVCGDEITLEGNACDGVGLGHPAPPDVRLLETGSDPALFSVTRMFLRGNVGFPKLFDLHEHWSRVPRDNGPTGVHSWEVGGVRDSFRRRNFLESSLVDGGAIKALGTGTCKTAGSGHTHDGVPTVLVEARPSCTVTVLTLDLGGLDAELQGQEMYFLAQVQRTGTKGHLSARFQMMIDTGDGKGWRNTTSASTAADPRIPGWAVHATQATLGKTGVARFGLGVLVADDGGGNATAELGMLVVARVGDDWSSLPVALKSDDDRHA
jgi:parallel beta-helix repeat protein